MLTITKFFTDFKPTLIILLVLGLIIGASTYVYGLNDEISTLKKVVIERDATIEKKIVTIALRDVQIAENNNAIKDLADVIERQNEKIKELAVSNEEIESVLKEYKSKPPSIKYIEKKTVVTCEELKTSVDVLKGLKYEDF